MHYTELKEGESNGSGENIMEKTERQREGVKLKKTGERRRGSEAQTQKPLSLLMPLSDPRPS